MNQPLVSCIMPTWNRRAFVHAAIDCWLKQTYENRDLIVLDDGEDRVEDLIPDDSRIRYVFLDSKAIRRIAIGEKRNTCCELAGGEVICHFDDDDWSAPDRITDQVHRLQDSGLPITGYGTLLFWDTASREAKRYRAAVAGYVCGTTLCYLRSYWQAHSFPNKSESEDNAFVYSALKQIAGSNDASHMVARIHNCQHTSSKKGISEMVSKDLIPAAFWDNERTRLKAE